MNLPTFREKSFAYLFRAKQLLDTHSDNKASSFILNVCNFLPY